jgi:hypothetical protein
MTLGGWVIEGLEGANQRMDSAAALQVRVFD